MTVLNVHDLGDPAGTPLLAIHGITSHGLRYRRLAEEAWPERRTIAVDLRGHGRSTYGGPWSVAQHVRDLLDTLDSLGIERLDVVGHSYGGEIGLALLTTAPERVRSLVLLDPALAQTGEWSSEAALETIADPGWESVEAATIERNEPFETAAIDPAVTEDIAQHLVQSEDGRFRFRYFVPAVVAGWGEMSMPLPTAIIACPALLVVADQAELVSAETEAALIELFEGTLSTVHLDCGHMVYWDKFDETAAAIVDFWASTAS